MAEDASITLKKASPTLPADGPNTGPPVGSAEEAALRQEERLLHQFDLSEAEFEQEERLISELMADQQMDHARGMTSTMLDVFDIPGHIAGKGIDLLTSPSTGGPTPTGFDAGEMIQRGINSIVEPFDPFFGVQSEFAESVKAEDTFKKDGVPTGGFRMMGEAFFNVTRYKQEAVFGAEEGTPTQQFIFGRYFGEGLVGTLAVPYLKVWFKTAKAFGPRTKYERFKNFLREAGEAAAPTIKEPMPLGKLQKGTALAIAAGTTKKYFWNEMVAIGGGALGQEQAQKRYPDSALADFVFSSAGSVGIQVLPSKLVFEGGMSLWQSMKNRFSEQMSGQLDPSGRSMHIAQRSMLERARDLVKAKKNFETPEQVIEAVRELATPAELTFDDGLLAIQRAFIEESDESVLLGDLERWKKMQEAILHSVSAPTQMEVTEETFRNSLRTLNAYMKQRDEVAKIKMTEMVMEFPHLNEAELHRRAYHIVENEYEIVRQTDAELWSLVDLDARVPNEVVLDNWRDLLLKTLDEEGGESLLYLGGKGNKEDLFKFFGRVETTPPVIDLATGKVTEGRRIVLAGEWGEDVSLGQLQALRHRVLLTLREERGNPLGADGNRIRKLVKVADSLLAASGALDRTLHGPLTELGMAYRRALSFSHMFADRFKKKEVQRLLNVNKRGDPTTRPEVALMRIFKGRGKREGAMEGGEISQELLKVTRPTDEGVAFAGNVVAQKTAEARERVMINATREDSDLLGAMEDVILGNFLRENVHNGVLDQAGAATFLTANRNLLSYFEFVKTKLDDAIKTGKTFDLHVRDHKQATKYFSDPDVSLAALWIKEGPETVFKRLNGVGERKIVNVKDIAEEIDTLIFLTGGKSAKDLPQRVGLDTGYFNWLMNQALIKGNNPTDPMILSGVQMRRAWETKQGKVIAENLLDQGQRDFVEQLIRSAELIDLARHAVASKQGTFFNRPTALMENLLRWSVLTYSPLARMGKGPGKLAAAGIVGKTTMQTFRDRWRMPGMKWLAKAFKDRDHGTIRALFAQDIENPVTQGFIRHKALAWMATSSYNGGERVVNAEEIDEAQKR